MKDIFELVHRNKAELEYMHNERRKDAKVYTLFIFVHS